MKKIDWYIIKKFLGTFFFTIALILVIVIIFDISEKIDDFLEHNLDKKSIAKYYLNFIPYFGNLFSHLFIFISVIFFTSRLANNTEIIAILNSGMSFRRLLRPFILSAFILAVISFLLGNFIIPVSNIKRIDFENKYFSNKTQYPVERNIHIQVNPGQYIYMESFNTKRKIGYKFSLENFKNGQLTSRLKSNYITFDSTQNRWQVNQYEIRDFLHDPKFKKGTKLDTVLNLHPKEFTKNANLVETMNMFELNKYIAKEELKGSQHLIYYKIEKHKRIAFPFASIILTLIAVAIASKKIRGKIGAHLGIGILVAFTYILFMQISTTFATNSNLTPEIAVWIPNFIYMIIGGVLIYNTQR